MWVKFIKCKKGLGYFAGDQVDLSEETAKQLIDEGFAQTLTSKPNVESDLPLDLKGRDALIKAGLVTKNQVLAAKETLTDIKGIGKAMEREIIEKLSVVE
ncbi:MAG: hypothetical protein LBV72_10075 [Tannerella sp.]|jgi:hypothetical protein|nr:hypothetical protein [Tannerella sp.]